MKWLLTILIFTYLGGYSQEMISQSRVINLIPDLAAKEPLITGSNSIKRYLNGYKQFVSLNTDSITAGSTNLWFTNVIPTVIGGAGTTSTLTLQTTSGVGTTNADMIFQGGNNGATEFARFLNSGFFGIGQNAPTQLLTVGGFNTTNSNIKTGSLEFQPFALNNAWIGENIYNNSGFKARATGPSGLFYFLGLEGQFRFNVSANAGASVTQVCQFKINATNNAVALGGSISTSSANYTGATLFANNNGVSIGAGAVPAASAVLDVVSTTKGVLMPRMTSTQGSAISSPADGLIIYVTDTNGTFTAVGFWGRVAGAWAKLN